MKKKLIQITDTVHQTIYLSELESKMMSTAYFYRLNDVYQCSTVYLTFPGNRTKRYEHSLGTMLLAGEMFFSAITNASASTRQHFFVDVENQFNILVEKLLRDDSPSPVYYSGSQNLVKQCFTPANSQTLSGAIEKNISNAYKRLNLVEDAALNHYIPPFSDNLSKYKFLYQCLLEAVRIVALFHDIGHPPYSHIIEDVLNELYLECKASNNTLNSSQVDNFIQNLRPFKEPTNDIPCLLSTEKCNKSALHERIGLKMLSWAFDDVFTGVLQQLDLSEKNIDNNSAIVLYHATVAEFCFAILRESTSFFRTLHRIVDGCIDVDRMDYIVRDSHNSGINWGTIPYKRVLDSCKMMEPGIESDPNRYVIAFPCKMSGHLDDLLIMRYKVFSQINFHHRSYKTSLILQKLVKDLAINFLEKGESKIALCPGIVDLWNCLSHTMSSGHLYIIQWNDSTLISHLYKTLTELKYNTLDTYDIPEEKYIDITKLLEEFLLNRKYFDSVFKRQSDFDPIFNRIYSMLTPEELAQISAVANAKGMSFITSPSTLSHFVFSEGLMFKIISEVLDEYKSERVIGTYLFAENKKRSCTGLPCLEDSSDTIYLYEPDGEKPTPYDVSILENQLIKLQSSCLRYIAYIDSKGHPSVVKDIRNTIEHHLYNAIKEIR